MVLSEEYGSNGLPYRSRIQDRITKMQKLLLTLILFICALGQCGWGQDLTDQQIIAADQNVKQLYNQLLPMLNQEGQRMLINDQQHWLQYRDQLVRQNPDNEGGAIYQSSMQRITYLKEIMQNVRRQIQTQNATRQAAALAKKKAEEPKGQPIKVPDLPSDIANCVLNPETKVWEKQSEQGKSSEWHNLIATNSTNPIQVDIRTQYNGFRVGSESDNNIVKTWPAIYGFIDSQNLFNSYQYQVINDDESGITLGSAIPLEKKNLQAITEYPVSLEFQISNKSDKIQKIKDISLFVEDYYPIEKTIPFVIKDWKTNKFYFANLGWGKIIISKLELNEFADYLIIESLGHNQFASIDKGNINIDGENNSLIDLNSIFFKAQMGWQL